MLQFPFHPKQLDDIMLLSIERDKLESYIRAILFIIHKYTTNKHNFETTGVSKVCKKVYTLATKM